MKKLFFLIAVFLFSTFFLTAQSNYVDFWDNLLKNNREEAFKILNKKKDNSTEWLILNEISRIELGQLEKNKDFIEKFLKQDDFEHYLFAFWSNPFIFDDYLGDGFNDHIVEAINKITPDKVENIDLVDALVYLRSAERRHFNDWESYYQQNAQINSIKDWQYCGAFENMNKSGIDKFHEPETEASNDKVFDARSNGSLKWYPGIGKKEAYQFYENHVEYGSGVHYAQTFITSSIDQRVTLRLGSGSAFKIFLNDIEIFKNDKDVNTDLNGYELKVNLPKGTNRLLIKSAESTSTSYFMLSILDENKAPLDNFIVSSQPVAYNSSSLDQLNPEEKENDFESFFKVKVKQNPEDFFYSYALFNTYIRNSKYDEARAVIQPFYEEYPQSSFLRKALITTYKLEGDSTSINEINENIERDDPEYYLPILNKIGDYNELLRMSMTDFEDYIAKLKKAFDSKLIHASADFFYYARKENIVELQKTLDAINKNSIGNQKFNLTFIPLYDQIFQDQDKTVKLLEDMISKTFSIRAENMLIRYYEDRNQKDRCVDLITKYYDELKTDNAYIKRIVDKLIEYQRYKEALPYVDQLLENYPYSFVAMEYKGDILRQLDKNKEALKYYRQALEHNSADSGLRKKITDLSKKEDIIKDLIIEDVYAFVDKHRNKITKNNYGFNILLDDSNVEIYEEGGFKYRYIYVYEITSNNGVETFKEYNLGLTGSYNISKSELIKPSGSIVPADRRGSSLVFTDISIGDVVYIDYEGTRSTSGRFYKDISDKYQFYSFHPIVKSSAKVLVPNTTKINYEFINGDLKPTIKKKDKYTLYQWDVNNPETLPYAEDYMPNTVDAVGYLHFSTIQEWDDVSEWYSDLVRSRIEINDLVKAEFKKLFPNGHENLSEDQRAKIIYNYVAKSFNYSYVSFRQSGFIPQKPAKTINTKLGDCKDFSTLYITMAKMAGLKSNLVLVLTSDYGRNNLVLPSTDFNHCIVKVFIDGKEQFLELTDKYLPYKSLPTSLRGATALEIPFDSEDNSKKYNLIHLDNVNRDFSEIKNVVTLNISEKDMNLLINTNVKGHNTSYYNQVFDEPNPEVIRKSILEDYKGKLVDDFNLNKVSDISNSNEGETVSFKSDLTINKKLNSIGSIKILQLPIITHPYESSIIQLEERNFPIDYIQYEYVDNYVTDYIIDLDESQSFVEIPESKSFTFKEHSYSITYENPQPNKLTVSIKCKTSLDNISPEDYTEYKLYVKSILDAEAEYIGFK
jgi:transglutaminase-like putative cysteine protease